MLTALCIALLGSPSGEASGGRRVKHVVYLMFENHAFDNLLGWHPHVDGVNVSKSKRVCNNFRNKTYCPTTRGAYVDPDPRHGLAATAEQLYGFGGDTNASEHNPAATTLAGFVSNYAKATGSASEAPAIMDCFLPPHVPIISTLANEFTLLDGYHASVPGPTFPNRLFAMSSTSNGFTENDIGQTVGGWPQRSIFSQANEAKASWKVYFSDVPSTFLLTDARNSSDLSKYSGLEGFYQDAKAGQLPTLSWLDPGYFDLPGIPATDQHPSHDVLDGERLLKSVYEALRDSPSWDETVLLVTYDEHGGYAEIAVGISARST